MKSRDNSNNRQGGSQTERSFATNSLGIALREKHEKEKPLLIVKVNLGDKYGEVSMGVWKEDNASTISERIIRQSGAVFKNTQE